MIIQDRIPPKGRVRASRIGLNSQRYQKQMIGDKAKRLIDQIKLKDRSYLKLQQWNIKNYYASNAIELLKNCPDQIDRRNAQDLSVDQFIEKYQKTCKPVIIKGCTQNWKKNAWTHKSFYQKFGNVQFKVGQDDKGRKLRMPLKYYFQYLVYNTDDSPLYLFQSSLEDKEDTRPILDNYQIPKYFKDDLFSYAGDKKRPPYRWLIMGPQRSGTTVHLDPLATSAWNTSLAGNKRWVLFDPKIPKSIVKGKQFRGKDYQDQAINYFIQILPLIKQKYQKQKLGLIQFIQGPGETVFVPGGLWHAVINLDQTIAITQNVMTHYCFDKVWRSTRCQRRKFAEFYLQNLHKYDQQLYDRAIKLNQQDEYKMGNKYQIQSVSMSFTGSSSSDSSSSSSEQSSSSFDSSQNGSKPRKRVSLTNNQNDIKRSKSLQASTFNKVLN